MLKIFIGLLLLTLLISCSSSPTHIVLAGKLRSKYINQSTKEGLYASACGGALMYNVDMISVSFTYQKPMNIDQARVLYVRKMREFLDLINNDEKIRPYLSRYPFLPEQFNLSIYFEDQNSNYYSDDYLAFVMIGKGGVVVYGINDANNNFADVHKEPFEEAERIVQQQCNRK